MVMISKATRNKKEITPLGEYHRLGRKNKYVA